jgi:hypothetical protein
MTTKLLLIGLAALGLTACQTVEQAAVRNSGTACAQHGHRPGTAQHDGCVQQLAPYAMHLEQQRRSAMISNGIALMAASRQQAAPPVAASTIDPPSRNLENRPIWCMRSAVGGQIVCN